jgi:hypothetical protein
LNLDCTSNQKLSKNTHKNCVENQWQNRRIAKNKEWIGEYTKTLVWNSRFIHFFWILNLNFEFFFDLSSSLSSYPCAIYCEMNVLIIETFTLQYLANLQASKDELERTYQNLQQTEG